MPVHLPVLPRRQATTLSQSELPWTYWICLQWPRLLRQDEATFLTESQTKWQCWVAVPGYQVGYTQWFWVLSWDFAYVPCRVLMDGYGWICGHHNSSGVWKILVTNIIPSISDHEFEWFLLKLMFTFGMQLQSKTPQPQQLAHRDEFSPQAKVQWWYLPWDVVKLALRREVREKPSTEQSGTLMNTRTEKEVEPKYSCEKRGVPEF